MNRVRRDIPIVPGVDLALLSDLEGRMRLRVVGTEDGRRVPLSAINEVEDRRLLEHFVSVKTRTLGTGFDDVEIRAVAEIVVVLIEGVAVGELSRQALKDGIWAFLQDVDGVPAPKPSKPQPQFPIRPFRPSPPPEAPKPQPARPTVDEIWRRVGRRGPTETRTETPNGDRIYPEDGWRNGRYRIRREVLCKDGVRRPGTFSGRTQIEAQYALCHFVREVREALGLTHPDWDSFTLDDHSQQERS